MLFSVISRTLVEGGSYPSVEMQLMYTATPADWASKYDGMHVYMYTVERKRDIDGHIFQTSRLINNLF